MAFKLHHIVLRVDHLENAIKDFTRLGFNVIPGGAYNGKIYHNAFIAFSDQSYIELLAIKPGIQASGFKFLFRTKLYKLIPKLADYSMVARFYLRPFNCSNGIIDYALLVEDQDQINIKKRGFWLSKPFSASLVNPNGEKLRWDLIDTKIREFPFLIANIYPTMTFPNEAMQHPNGTLGIENLFIIPKQFLSVFNQYYLFLALAPDFTETENTNYASFHLLDTAITIIQEKSESALKESIKQYGVGRFALKLRGYDRYERVHTDLLRKYGLVLARQYSDVH